MNVRVYTLVSATTKQKHDDGDDEGDGCGLRLEQRGGNARGIWLRGGVRRGGVSHVSEAGDWTRQMRGQIFEYCML